MAQATVGSVVTVEGQGLHSGRPVRLEMHPAPAGHGIVFRRSDISHTDNLVPASYKSVVDTTLCTTIGNRSGVKIQTIEHLMAALSACGISNALVDINDQEVPGVDGSALPFTRMILKSEVFWQKSPVEIIRVLRPVSAECTERPGASAQLIPSDHLEMEFRIEYPDPVGVQSRTTSLANGAIAGVLSDSRTFCRLTDIAKLQSNGYGLGGSSEIVLILDCESGRYVNKRRYEDECVRHKMLDAVGDLALAGLPIVGKFVGIKSGHALNLAVLRELFSSRKNYEIILADDNIASKLPGVKLSLQDLPSIH